MKEEILHTRPLTGCHNAVVNVEKKDPEPTGSAFRASLHTWAFHVHVQAVDVHLRLGRGQGDVSGLAVLQRPFATVDPAPFHTHRK